jgi:hypothetical protein
VVLSPTFKWAAKEVLNSEYKPYTGNNEINPLADEGVSYMISRYLTSPRSWFLLTAKSEHRMKFWWRTRPETSSADDFQSGDMLYKGFARYSTGFSEWRGVYGSSGG